MAANEDASPPEAAAVIAAEDATAVDEAANALSSIAVIEDAASDDDEGGGIPPPPPAALSAAPLQFNFNLPAAAANAAANNPPNNLDLANLNADQINAHFLSLLPKCIHPRVNKLNDLHEQRTELLEKYLVERAALEQKYHLLLRPLYEMRRDVVSGVLDEEIAVAAANDAGDGNSQDYSNDETAVKGIPQFWACAMGHIDILAELITEQDIDCLDHLTDITCTDFNDGSGFELHFHFSPNQFFTNAVLTKRYEVPNLLTEDEPMLQNVTGTEIHWKSDAKCLTHRIISKKQRKKGGVNAGQIRTIQKKERVDSFFHFFMPPVMPNLGDVVDEEEADAMDEHFDHDYEVACAIRGSLIPNAVGWFTGEAAEGYYGDDDILDDEEEEEEGEEEGGVIGGNNDGGGFVFNNPNGANPFPPPAAGNGENPECQQN